MAGLSDLCFATSDSVPSSEVVGAALLLSSRKASVSWFFCRLSFVSRATYSPAPINPGTVRAFIASATTSPSADFCCPVRADHSSLSFVFETNSRSPEVSSPRLRRATAGFTTSAFNGYGLRGHVPARPTPYASDPVFCTSARAFAPRFLQTPLHSGALAICYHFTSITL